MNKGTNYLQQWDEATKAAEERERRMRELAKKHNVTLSNIVHDELIVEGDPENVAAFQKEWLET